MTMGHRAAGGPARFEALDGLRGLCALMVVLLHLPLSGWLGDVALFKHAFLFVDFFFVLSGFVIAHSYGGRLSSLAEMRRFAASRWRRVYPLHLAMLLLFLAFELAAFATKGPDVAFQGGNSVSAFAANLLLVHAFGTVSSLGWNYPSWSISAEFGAYLLFALGAVVLGRRLGLALGLAIAVALPALALLAGNLDTTVSFGWLRCILGFSCGALLRLHAWRPPSDGVAIDRSSRRASLVEAGVIILVLAFVILAGASPASLAAPFLFTLAVWVFAKEEGAVSRLLKAPECAFLGLVSYSIYMTHAFVISRLINVGTVVEARTGLDLVVPLADGSKAFAAAASPLALTSALVLTVALATLTHRFVETPGQRLHRPRRQAATLRTATP